MSVLVAVSAASSAKYSQAQGGHTKGYGLGAKYTMKPSKKVVKPKKSGGLKGFFGF